MSQALQPQAPEGVDAVVKFVAGQMTSRLSISGKMPVGDLEYTAVQSMPFVHVSRGQYERATNKHAKAAVVYLSQLGHINVESGFAVINPQYKQSLQSDGEY